jgi:hypothetical protein
MELPRLLENLTKIKPVEDPQNRGMLQHVIGPENPRTDEGFL